MRIASILAYCSSVASEAAVVGIPAVGFYRWVQTVEPGEERQFLRMIGETIHCNRRKGGAAQGLTHFKCCGTIILHLPDISPRRSIILPGRVVYHLGELMTQNRYVGGGEDPRRVKIRYPVELRRTASVLESAVEAHYAASRRSW